MRSHSEEDFIVWLKSVGIELHPSYPKTAILSYSTKPGQARFWEVPAPPEKRSYFLASMLELMGDWNSCYVWRHMGSWHATDTIDPRRINDVVENEIHRGLGLPLGTAQIIEFGRDELPKLVTLLFATTIFGWSVGEDLYVIPNHARYILKTDHHGVVHIEFKQITDVADLEAAMLKRGFSLPDELLDETFKKPEWMQ